MFDIIVATDEKNGIGKNNSLPWHLPEDLHHFKLVTLNSCIIMGHNTWKSLPNKPLPSRTNIIISSTNNLNINQDAFIVKYNPYRLSCLSNSVIYVFSSLQLALDCVENSKCSKTKNTFVIGGEQLYNEAINHPECNNIYMTRIYKNFDCDKFFPELPPAFNLSTLSKFKFNNTLHFRFILYSKNSTIIYRNSEEESYLQLLRNIIGYGVSKGNRTGVNTLSLFAEQLKYNLRDTFPILTTRKQFLRGIFEELLFYLRGQTDNKILVDKGVNVWTGNTTREFLDSRNLLNYEEGDMGPTYGFNFRNFGGCYKGCNNIHATGVDQLEELVQALKTDQDSRRMIISLWDPKNNKKAALPSCMCFYQFYVSNNELNLQVYIRSSDYFLANNWNTCTAALFVHLLCNIDGINLTPGDLTVVMGDVHIYNTQLEAIKSCLDRKPKPFPKLVVNSRKDSITDFSFDDIELIGYESDKRVKVDMVV